MFGELNYPLPELAVMLLSRYGRILLTFNQYWLSFALPPNALTVPSQAESRHVE